MGDATERKFQIGFAMSGAISAGAYTAGVFDFLIEALDEWEKAWAEEEKRLEREGGEPRIPKPEIGLKVMSGASAGAITAAVGAVALADGNQKPDREKVKPLQFPEKSPKDYKFSVYLPKLYTTWVVMPNLASFDDLSKKPKDSKETDFLDTIDVTERRDPIRDFSRAYPYSRETEIPPEASGTPTPNGPIPVAALLNWRLLDDIAEAALLNIGPTAQRAYVSDKLHIYLTLSNLRGIPYEIPFSGGAYYMISHGDRVHYEINGLGGWSTGSDSKFADSDKKRVIEAGWLRDDKTKSKWKDFSVCALASAAFPVGLAARDIGTIRDEYDGGKKNDGAEGTVADPAKATSYRHFPIDGLLNGAGIKPNWPAAMSKEYWFRTADGGIIDNDPFEYAHLTLQETPGVPNPNDPERADRAVIMISPFPEQRPIRPEGQPSLDIASIYSALLPSLINQARFKPSELVHAADEDYASRYLIGPSRTWDIPKMKDGKPVLDKNNKPVIDQIEQRYGIASGLLGGFGGFLAEDFRDHDFHLGRRNCQKFLKDAFALPHSKGVRDEKGNIVRDEEGNIVHPGNVIGSWPDEAKSKENFQAKGKDKKGRTLYTLIPLFGTATNPVELRKWPQIKERDVKVIEHRIAQRFDEIAPRLIDQNVRGFLGVLLGLSVGRYRIPFLDLIRTKILEFAGLAIRADLVRRNQIEDWNNLGTLPEDCALDPDDVRAVLAELLDPSLDMRTVAGLARAMAAQRPSRSDTQPESLAIAEGEVAKLLTEYSKASVSDDKLYKVWKAPWKDKAGNELYALKSRAGAWLSWDSPVTRLAVQSGIALDRLGAGWIGNYFPKPRTDPPGVA